MPFILYNIEFDVSNIYLMHIYKRMICR